MAVDNMLLIGGMAVAVFFTRYAALALFGAAGPPAGVVRWLRHVPVAVLAALVAPALLLPQGHFDLGPANHHLMAGAAAILVAWRRHGFVPTVVGGTVVMLALRWLWA